MNKKSIIVLLVLVLALSGLFAKDSGIKVGGQLGWGFDIARMKTDDKNGDEDSVITMKAKNNGFAFNLTGEYDFDKNWGVVANLGMMFAGKTTLVITQVGQDKGEVSLDTKAGLYIDFALDAKYTYAINEKVSVAGLAGLELVAGHLAKDYEKSGTTLNSEGYTDSNFYNVAFGLNLGLEGSYKITDEITVVGGATGSWFFVNTAKIVNVLEQDDGYKVSGVASFYIRPYVGATYSF